MTYRPMVIQYNPFCRFVCFEVTYFQVFGMTSKFFFKKKTTKTSGLVTGATGVKGSVTGSLKPAAKMVAPATSAGVVSLVPEQRLRLLDCWSHIGPLTPAAQPTRPETQPLDGVRGSHVCFCKMFYQNFKVKFFTNFYKGFYGQRKIFYKFDEILHLNKHLKMRKYFLENNLLQNKWSVKNMKIAKLTQFWK